MKNIGSIIEIIAPKERNIVINFFLKTASNWLQKLY